MRQRIIDFTKSKQPYPIIAAISAGLYPLLHYYNSNLTMVNSWSHFLFFVAMFLVLPAIVFYILNYVFQKQPKLERYHQYLIPVLNTCWFVLLLLLGTYGMRKKLIVMILFFVGLLALVLHKYIKKLMVLQCIMAIMAVFTLIPKVMAFGKNTKDWVNQPDDIEKVEFVKHPNIYVIQPDGYANFSELKKGYYDFDNSQFEQFLKLENFNFYDGFRSNYASTLHTNSAMFGMKHHYYNVQTNTKLYDYRAIIVGDNPVISILNANNYKTHLLLEEPYFLLNRPKLAYDYCNIDYLDISYFSRGFDMDLDIASELKSLISTNTSSNNFYFLEKIDPAHIVHSEANSKGVDEERKIYLDRLIETNDWLTSTITYITENDDNALIVICADHGGFVGYKSMTSAATKTTDRDLIHSIFTSVLAIKWPENEAPLVDANLNSSVNVFRVLFSYLSDDSKYLNHLQEDSSYLRVEKEAPKGVYEVIDTNGKVVFNKVHN